MKKTFIIAFSVLCSASYAQQASKKDTHVKIGDTMMINDHGYPKPIVVTKNNISQFNTKKISNVIAASPKVGDTIMLAEPKTGEPTMKIVGKGGKYKAN